MKTSNTTANALRVTTLSAALLMAFGSMQAVVAAPAPPLLDNTLKCVVECASAPIPDTDYILNSTSGTQKWAVKGEKEAKFSIIGGTVEARGNQARAVSATGASEITLTDVDISTNGKSAHGVQAIDLGSKLILNDSEITTGSAGYAVGVSSQLGAEVTGSGNTIITEGAGSSGVEVDRGGSVSLTGGKITTNGAGAAGARAHSGKELGATRGSITLDGTTILTTGDGSIGLVAGDTDGAVDTNTAGDITFTNGFVTTEGASAAAARVENGSQLVVEKSTLTSDEYYGLEVRNTGSTATLLNTHVVTGGAAANQGDMPFAVYAGDGGVVTMTGGSAAATGDTYTRAILAETGGNITTTNTAISTVGTKSHAVQAQVDKNNTGALPTITLNGGTVTTAGNDSWGLYASRGGQITSSADITTLGDVSFGAFVENGGEPNARGGKITLNDGSVTTKGKGSHAVVAKYAGNSAEINGTRIETQGDNATALLAELGASITAKDADITTGGLWAFGANATGGGTIDLDGGSITTVNVKGKGTQDGDGSRAYAIQASGAGSKVTTNNGTSILTEGQRAYGAYAVDKGEVELNGGSITTNGFMGYGVYASGADSKLTTQGVNITTTGDAGDAVWAYNGGTSTINGGTILVDGGPNAKVGETANGLVANGGSAGVNNGVINVHGATITTTGVNSVGALAGADIGSNKTSGTINLDNTAVTVTGAEATAATVLYGSTLTATNGTKLVSTQGNGIVMTDNATVVLNNTTVEAKGASLVSNLRTSGAQQNITVGDGSTLAVNNGTLLQVNRNAAGQDANVSLALESGAFTGGNVDDRGATGTGKTTVANNGAHWAGIILNNGDDVVEDGASQNYDGANISGSVASGADSSITFSNNVVIQGSLSAGAGSSAVFQGAATINNNLAGQRHSSIVFNGLATIGQGVTGLQGSSFVFSDTATIGSGTGTVIAGQGAAFSFIRTGPSLIQGDVLLTSGSSFVGGSAAAPIQITGSVDLANSTLGGNLNVLGTLVSSGGVFSPGNSIGIQTFESVGALTDSEYVAEINAAGQSDKIVVNTGNVDIGGVKLTVAQENGNGGYLLNHDYTILETKAGQVVNQFRDPTLAGNFDSLAKLDVKYDNPSDVRVGISVDDDKVAAARTGWSANQNATFDGLMSAASGNTLATAALIAPDVKDALNQLSGEVHASTQSALMNSAGVVTRTLSNRMRSNLAASAPAGSALNSAAYPLWAEVVGSWNTLDDDGNAAKVKTDIGGLFIGGDAAVGSSGWRLGGALGFTDSKIKVDDRSSRSDVTSYTAAIYGGNSWETAKGSINFLAGAAYTRHDVDSRRTTTVGGNQTLKASYDVDATQLFTELGYALPVGAASTVEPYLGLAWLNQKAKGFSESGGSAALAGSSQKDDITTFTLGLRGNTAVDVGQNQARLMAGLGWRHAAGDVDATRTMSFIQGNGVGFKIAGAPIAKNAAVLDLAAEMDVGSRAAMGLSYSGQFGNGNTDNAGTLYVKVKF